MKYKSKEIIDINKVSQLLESYSKATGLVSALLDLDGNILSRSGWQNICTKFHRINPETARNCHNSDTILAGELQDGNKYNVYKCLNGLTDVAVPIIVNDIHVYNLFTGQFFMESPDKEFFIAQADKYNFDKKEYMYALSQVPVIKKSEIKNKLLFLSEMTEIIVELGIAKYEYNKNNIALKESEEKYKALYENAPLSYQSLDKDGCFIDVNPTWLRTLGYTREEVLGKWFGDFLHPDFIEYFKINFPEFKKRGFINDVQFRIRHKKGNYLYISFEGCIGYNTDGTVKQTYCTFKDITSEILAKKELIIAKEKAEQNEEKFSGIYEQSPIAIAIYDVYGKLIDINHQTLKMFGVEDKTQISGFVLWENPQFPAEKLETLKNGNPFFISTDFDFEVVKLNKLYPTSRSGKIYVDVYAVPLMDKGKVNGYLVQIMDVTERKQVEKALLVNQNRYKKAQAIGHVGNWEYDPKTTKFWASDETRRIFGYDTEQKDFTTENVESCIPERDRVHKALIELVEHDKKYDIVYDILTEDKGIRKTVYSIAEIERDALGNPSKISGVVSDISKQKKAEEKLKDSEYLYKESQRLGKMGGWSYDVESGKSTFTDTLYEIYGKIFSTAEEGLQFYHPDDKELVFNLFNEALTKQKPYDVEVRFINALGNTLFVRTIGRPVIKNGKVVKLYGNLIDITERRQAEDEIKKYQEHLEDLVKERTKNLEEKNKELERFNKLFVDREFRIKELKDKVKELENKL